MEALLKDPPVKKKKKKDTIVVLIIEIGAYGFSDSPVEHLRPIRYR